MGGRCGSTRGSRRGRISCWFGRFLTPGQHEENSGEKQKAVRFHTDTRASIISGDGSDMASFAKADGLVKRENDGGGGRGLRECWGGCLATERTEEKRTKAMRLP